MQVLVLVVCCGMHQHKAAWRFSLPVHVDLTVFTKLRVTCQQLLELSLPCGP
jgi:hypothetical protein